MMNATFSSQADLFADMNVVDRDGFVEETVESPLVSSRRGEDVHMTPSHIPRMNVLFSSRDELIEKIDEMGRDAFVAEIAGNPEMYQYRRDTSRRRQSGDNDGTIYLLICLVNKKVYIGQSCNFDIRMKEHFREGGKPSYIKNAIAKHGRESFVAVILLTGIEQQEDLDSTEIVTIKHLDCLAPGKKGYNLHPGGRGGPLTYEHRKKIADSNRGRPCSNDTRYKISTALSGKTRSYETRTKIGDKNRGRTHSDETRKKMRVMHARAVVITLAETREELVFDSCGLAANAMGVCRRTIGCLNIGKLTKSKSNGGEYKNAYFTSRYRDLVASRTRGPPSEETLAKLQS